MPAALDLSVRTETSLLIAFADLTRYTAHVQRTRDAAVAETINSFYRFVSDTINAAGGCVVKFIGDATLIVFPEELVDAGVEALLALKRGSEAFLADQGWDSRMVVKVHFGPAIAGPYGTAGDERFDVIGSAVNTAARLETRSFALSAQAFRKLAPATRKHFKKHTPPITYIRSEDRHGQP